MIKLAFPLPSSDYLFDPFRGDPFTHFCILTLLEASFPNEIEVCLPDLRGVKREFALQHIPECDIYLHSVYTLDFEEQVGLLKQLRQIYPKSVHIAGGPHVNVFTEEAKSLFDTVILGEGEEAIVEAIRDYKEGALKKTYRANGKIDINQYPFWKRHYLPKSAIIKQNLMTVKRTPGFEKLWGTTVIFSRGCPYRCHFCAMQYERDAAPGIRFRKPEHVEAELNYLKNEFGVQGVVVNDEIAIPLVPRLAIPHLEAIGRTGVKWRGQCRVDGITPEIASLAAASGCLSMGMGVESVHQASLDIINKSIKVEKAKETIKLWKKNGIESRVYLIMGLPGEPKDIVERTWNFIQETDPDMVYLSLFTVRPGTEVFKNPRRFGIKRLETDWKKTMHLFSRYEDETPQLTFEYMEDTPWGKSLSNSQIVANYLELQSRLKKRGLGSFYKIENELQKSLPQAA